MFGYQNELKYRKLENVNHQDKRIIARCPACAEYGNDNKGDHLSIDKEGRFCCAVYTGVMWFVVERFLFHFFCPFCSQVKGWP